MKNLCRSLYQWRAAFGLSRMHRDHEPHNSAGLPQRLSAILPLPFLRGKGGGEGSLSDPQPGVPSGSCKILSLFLILILFRTGAEPAMPLPTFSRLPVKEITVFKDGHAFVAHEGELPCDSQGNVLMDYLP